MAINEASKVLRPIYNRYIDESVISYGRAKVACEDAVRHHFDQQFTIMRPQILVGPYDYTGRYSYWIERIRKGGKIIAPGDGTDYMQVADARDLARFTLKAAEQKIFGVFNVSGPRVTWSNFFEMLKATDVQWITTKHLREWDINPTDFPLYIPTAGRLAGIMAVDNSMALAAGLVITDPFITAADTLHCNQLPSIDYTPLYNIEKEILERL